MGGGPPGNLYLDFPDQVILMRITADKPRQISFTTSVDSPLPLEVKTNGNNELVYQGISGDHQGLRGKVRYQGRVKILTNLAELADPLVQMVRELSETGRETARVMYGSGG